MRSKIVLIRHGITPGNLQRFYYGATDIPLAYEGIVKLKKLKKEGVYPDSETAEYYTSGMLRAEQTFEILYGDKPHEKLNYFRELNFGDFEMKAYEELESRPEYRDWCNTVMEGTPPPNGESILDFSKRVTEGFKDLRNRHGLLELKLRNQGKEAMSIVVCHGGVICALLNSFWPEKHDNFYRWIPDPGHGYVLTLEDGDVTDAEKF